MATTAPTLIPHNRHARRRPFSSWMRRLTNLKHNATTNLHNDRKTAETLTAKQRRNLVAKNNPYPESGLPLSSNRRAQHGHSRETSVFTTVSQETGSILSYEDTRSTRGVRVLSTRSAAGTVATNPDTIQSEAAQSQTRTNITNGGAMSARTGGNSTFSTPQHSQESLTTTLTTLQSTAPSALAPAAAQSQAGGTVYTGHAPPYIPAHLATQHHQQHTYTSATANNVLSDDASVLTLASSSKRRRRHSLDTNASVRALAPSSLFGASRESLPLSVLSSNVEGVSGVFHPPPSRSAVGGLASAERVSVYSVSGVLPVLSNERSNHYTTAPSKQQVDGASVRSGLHGHGRTESISGSITGITAAAPSPVTSPKDGLTGRNSRRNSDWQDPEALNWNEDVQEETENEEADVTVDTPNESASILNEDTTMADVKGKGRAVEEVKDE